ncbi:thiamine phosphate synthase [Oceanobacillus arenosus]|uniref:thiamine phosphate synthase n=1 Tax=Oceanobacillus arenosus TaxID=1229153 RepID=UPI002482F479|nr:thiamine phosphate synthase [Oceanobacillus arenosus]
MCWQVVDYIDVGPIFNTTTKLDAKSAVGLEWITTLRRHFPDLPIVLITTENATSTLFLQTAKYKFPPLPQLRHFFQSLTFHIV